MAKKNITIEDLAIMIQKEFHSVGDRFDGTNKQFESVDKRFDRLEENDRLILKRLEGMIYRTEFEQLESRVSELENLLAFDSKKH